MSLALQSRHKVVLFSEWPWDVCIGVGGVPSLTWSEELWKVTSSPPAEESTGELTCGTYEEQCLKPQTPHPVKREHGECVQPNAQHS